MALSIKCYEQCLDLSMNLKDHVCNLPTICECDCHRIERIINLFDRVRERLNND